MKKNETILIIILAILLGIAFVLLGFSISITNQILKPLFMIISFILMIGVLVTLFYKALTSK